MGAFISSQTRTQRRKEYSGYGLLHISNGMHPPDIQGAGNQTRYGYTQFFEPWTADRSDHCHTYRADMIALGKQ